MLEYRIEILFDGENANEDRLAREAFDIFMNDLLLKTFDGREQYVPVISPEMTEDDYQLIGSIMYLFFINFGIFPIQLAQKSLIHIFGNTLSPSILLSSFFTTISKRKEKVLFEAYQEISFERLSVIDVLSTYGIRSSPTTENVSDLILKEVAESESLSDFLRFVTGCS